MVGLKHWCSGQKDLSLIFVISSTQSQNHSLSVRITRCLFYQLRGVLYGNMKTSTESKARRYEGNPAKIFWSHNTKHDTFQSHQSKYSSFFTVMHWIKGDIQHCHIVADKVFDKKLMIHGLIWYQLLRVTCFFYYLWETQTWIAAHISQDSSLIMNLDGSIVLSSHGSRCQMSDIPSAA